MASFSLSITKEGAARVMAQTDFTAGTSAPGAGDLELRIDLDTNAMTKKDIILGLDKIKDYILGQGGALGLVNKPKF